jgi:hypothetical protein
MIPNISRKALIIVLFINIVPLWSDEYSDFRNLSPEQQIETIINDYRYGEYLGFKFRRLENILLERNEEIKPLLIDYLRRFDVPVYSDYSDQVYIIIDRIIWTFELLFNESEKQELADIYRSKLDKYLRTYKKIDNTVIGMEIMIHKFTYGRPMPMEPNYKQLMLEKYSKIYDDLYLDY